jgi:hypothetical protein
MNDTNPVSEAVQPISTDQKVGGSSPSKRTKTPQDLTSRGVFTISSLSQVL